MKSKSLVWVMAGVLLLCLCIAVVSAAPTIGVIDWQKTLGGSSFDLIYGVEQTADGNYIVAGTSGSTDHDITDNHGSLDIWVAKLDPTGTTIIWQKSLGGTNAENGRSVKQIADGGYIVVGATRSNDLQVSGNHGGVDFWVVKLDSFGTLVWQKCLGGSGDEYADSVQQTSDGGYIIAGYTTSTVDSGDVSGHHGGIYDYWVVKLDSGGNLVWQKCLGGTGDDTSWGGVQQTSDGGYIVAGWSNSNDGDVSGNHGDYDIWVVKLDSGGNLVWQKSLGGSLNDRISGDGIQQTPDGGYIVTGYTTSNDGDVSGNHGSFDIWIVKLNSGGNLVWQKCLGGTGEDSAPSVDQTSDGGYIVAGRSGSTDGDVTGNHGGYDAWVAKLNSDGTVLEMVRSLGGTAIEDSPVMVRQTSDGDYIIAASTQSSDGDVTVSYGSYDYWIVKLQTGSIAVSSVPSGANVYIDDTFKGHTPNTFAGYVGPHTVKVTLPTYFDVVRPVTVDSGQTASMSVNMDLIPAVLTQKAKEAVQATMTDVLQGDTSGVEVSVFNTAATITNPVIDVWPGQPPITFGHSGIVSYVDLMPDANDAHAGKFVNTYTDPADGKTKTETQNTNSPETKINGIKAVFTHGAGKQPSPGVLGIPNDPKVWAPTCNLNCDNYYALLISGGSDREHNHVRYWNDISYMYNVLIENNFKPSQIKVLMSDGTDTVYKDRHIATTGVEANDYDSSPLDLSYPADQVNEVNAAATKTNVNNYLAAYAPGGSTPLSAGKSLFIFTTSHGSLISGSTKDTNQVNLNLWNNEAISDVEFVTKLNAIAAGTNITVVMEQCNGGGFYDNWIKSYSGTQKRTLITAADWYEPSWGNGFSDTWTSGLAGHLRGATSTTGWDKSADTIFANDRVSLQESLNYVMPPSPAALRDPYATRTAGAVTGYEHPQIFYAGTSNDPNNQYLNDCSGTVTSKIDQITPATPSIWNQGSHQTISWKATALANRMVKVTLFKSTSTYPVVSCSPGLDAEKTTSVGWYVPSGTGTGVPPTGASYKIKVETCSGTSVSGTSAGTIQINPPATKQGTVTITTNPSTSIKLFWEGTQVATSTPYTRTDNEGKYSVRVTKDSGTDNPKYYPYDATVTITAGQTNTLTTWNLDPKPAGTNGEDLDPAPLGGILVNADQDPALVWMCKYDTCDPLTNPTCAHPTNCVHPANLETPKAKKDLKAGFSYDIYVTKDGFLPSAKQTVYIEKPNPYRTETSLFFTLTQKAEVPAQVLIVPQPLNIGRTGYFLAFVKLPTGYKAADVDAGSVYCEGAPALKLVRLKLFPQIFAVIFSRQDLDDSTTGNIKMSVRGLIKKNGDYDPFRGSTIVNVINKKVTTKEDVDSVMTMPDAQVFTKFNKF